MDKQGDPEPAVLSDQLFSAGSDHLSDCWVSSALSWALVLCICACFAVQYLHML